MLETRPAQEIQRILLLLQQVADEDLGEVEPSAYVRIFSDCVIRGGADG